MKKTIKHVHLEIRSRNSQYLSNSTTDCYMQEFFRANLQEAPFSHFSFFLDVGFFSLFVCHENKI